MKTVSAKLGSISDSYTLIGLSLDLSAVFALHYIKTLGGDHLNEET
ncbi:hypothetical protein [Lysinibacillus sphaericus]